MAIFAYFELGSAMTTKLNTAFQNVIADYIATYIGGGQLDVYSGSQPATANSTPTGTLLVTISTGSWNASSGGTATVLAASNGVAVASGTAGWGRISDAGLSAQADGTVGTSGANFTLNTVSIVSGNTITLTACDITQPAS